MTEHQHPITPPPELVEQWINEPGGLSAVHVATQAARWGADQELEACVKWIEDCGYHPSVPEDLRAAMRPEPPSLAEEAQRILVENGATLDGRVELDPEDVSIINAALERLQDLEKGNE